MPISLRLACVACCLAFGATGQAAPKVPRPQEPKRPYPYSEASVRYENPRAKVSLAGTLTCPKSDGPHPAVLLILGSGRLTRDEVVADHRIFLVLADTLTRRGIAVLRVDKRGLGESSGDYRTATSMDFADDVLAGVEFLKTRKEIDPHRIGLIGHSEGGLLAPMVANQTNDVAFVVSLGGPVMLGEKIFAAQGEMIGRARGDTEEIVAKRHEIMRKYHVLVRRGDKCEALAKPLRELMKEMPERDRQEVEQNIEVPISPWYRFFIDYDPAPTLTKVRCPILYFIGEKDLQVPAKENVAVAERARHDGGNKDFTIRTMSNINHALQTCKTGSPSEYGEIEETIAPAVLTAIGDWVLERTDSKRPKAK